MDGNNLSTSDAPVAHRLWMTPVTRPLAAAAAAAGVDDWWLGMGGCPSGTPGAQ